MSSQCKRPLEHSVSSQPIKHLCHSAVEEQASTGDASTTIYKIQRPVDMNSTWPVACNVIHLDSTDLQSARRSGIGMPEADGEVGCKEAWCNDLQVHTGHEALQDSVGCHTIAREASAFLQLQETLPSKEPNLPRRQLNSSALVRSVEPSLVEEWHPKQVIERAADCRKFEIQAEKLGMMHDNTIEHDREVNWSSGTEEGCLDSTACLQTIKKTLEAWLLNGGRPMLVHMGDKEVNVLTLYTWVNIMGGYKKVTDSGSWDTISDCLGLSRNCGPGVKLVYAKYFMTHATKMSLSLQAPADSSKPSAPQNFEPALQAQRKEANEEPSDKFVGWQLPCSDEVNQAGLNHIRSPLTEQNWGGQMPLHEKSLDRMVGWIKEIAVNLHTSQHSEGGMPCQEQSFQSLAGRVRSALWMRREELWTADGVIQARQLPAPSVYYEDPVQAEPQAKEQLHTTLEQSAHYGSQTPFPDHQPHSKRVPIGLDFQAHVLPWRSQDKTCYSAESGQEESRDDDDTPSSDEESYDSTKWLGSKMWPLSGCKRVVNKSRDGHGRQASCLCHVPGSQECVRLHIETEHQKLFGEIGQTFERWGFDQMGECVATQWTEKEERTFKAIVRLNPPSQNKNFWDELPSVFPNRSTSELVSYYFNVFVLRRRALQNRVSGARIDSDDDETELFNSGSDEDSSDDSFCEDHAREELRYPYEVNPDQRKAPCLQSSSRRQESSFTHSTVTGSALHFQSLVDDDDNADSSQEHFLRHGDSKVFHLDAEWKGKYRAAEEESPSQGELSLPWEHPHWVNTAYPSMQSADTVTPIQSALTEGQVVNQSHPNYAEIWGEPVIEISPTLERGKLLSTEGMIAELFGDE